MLQDKYEEMRDNTHIHIYRYISIYICTILCATLQVCARIYKRTTKVLISMWIWSSRTTTRTKSSQKEHLTKTNEKRDIVIETHDSPDPNYKANTQVISSSAFRYCCARCSSNNFALYTHRVFVVQVIFVVVVVVSK